MTKRNPYLQHTYESFDQPVPPRRPPQEQGLAQRILDSELGARLRSPLFATAALLITGAAFAGIIIASYPDTEKQDENIPVVTADASPLREAPSEPGGMDVAHEDSTIFGTIRSEELAETPPIENLLASEEPVDTQTAFAADTAASVEPAAGDLQPVPQAEKIISAAGEAPPPSEMADATQEIQEAGEPKPAEAAQVAETRTIPMKTEKVALADTAPEKPAMAPAASSPETLAYVRSVLEKKDTGGTPTAVAESVPEVVSIEPASGAATSAASAIEPGSSYVQLASISAESAAPKEWAKLQKNFPSLSGAEYRVQRADLGAKGVFFRIQAGPMSKDSAKSVCNAIKSEKPGGCLIVQ